ncbi:glycerol kinase [Aliidiomarina shirensis]|uniref:glycerol kinase n=1 Tax=Aliidiomarina shirensis TaxID=1048642 RepID=A0A432WVE8_9GAMM|nr:glycerol kinase GlpK [Aliidiomarina shirensis]RUO37745.1 glycerol kinase [Aliidiomarina shirensis]
MSTFASAGGSAAKHQGQYILAIDQGTTSSRAMIYNTKLRAQGRGQSEFPQYFPANGQVEHDPSDILETTLLACRKAIKDAGIQVTDIAVIGITNQRETTVVWDKASGKPIYRAIVWQDRRTAAHCQTLREQGCEALVQERTGLLLDPYFSATKIAWILDHVKGARQKAEAGELAFGTIDSFLLWHLSGGQVHATDATNASRTLLMNLHTREWDSELCETFGVPSEMLPEIKDNASAFGVANPDLFREGASIRFSPQNADKHETAGIPIGAMIGDQQGALVGQACIEPGQIKSTYGTGCFALVNTGDKPVKSEHRLLSTLGYQIDGKPTYALEGSIFMAGAIVQWLRDKLGIIQTAAETEQLAEGIDCEQSEILIPAFTGLGAPYWDPNARAAIFGMTRDTGKKQLAAAALRSVALQTRDLLQAMVADGQTIDMIKVDGGMTDNGWFMQALADITGHSVVRADTAEISVRGAAFLAGLEVGLFNSFNELTKLCGSKGTFTPESSKADRQHLHKRWLAAIAKVR